MKTSLAALLVVSLLSTSARLSALDLFVSPEGNDAAVGTRDAPLRSLDGARLAVRKLRVSESLIEPVTVTLRGGIYPLLEPVRFGPEDSGTEACPITYAAAPGETPILSGGRRIEGWREAEGGLWVADLPEVRAGTWSFRQLYVNGQARPRARTPNEGFLRVAGFPEGTSRTVNYHTDCQSFEFKPGDIRADWTNLSDVEVVVYHFWTDSHLPIRNVDTETNIVTFVHKAGKVFTDDFTTEGARYVVTNVFEGLDEPGEWYLNRKTGRLYYNPLPGEDRTRVEVVAPRAEAHVLLEGEPTSRKLVEHLRFRGFTFEYSNFELPRGDSNDRQGSASVPATIRLRGARDCTFEDCTIRNLGTFAFEVGAGCRGIRVAGNRLQEIGAGAVRVNGGNQGSHPLERTAETIIIDNEIGPYGVEYPSAVGVLLMNTEGNVVAHNHIHHGGYTGISAGWVWGYGRSISRDNRIEFNHIHHIGQSLLSDMGGIYTLGLSPGTVIRNNHIHDVEANQYGGWGIYNDEGSSHILIENNVVHDTKFSGYNIHYSKEITVRNNIFAFGRLEQLSRGRIEPHVSCYFEGNIVYWKTGELLSKNWKDQPYQFYLSPNKGTGRDGPRELTSTFEMDWNVYCNPELSLKEAKFNGRTWEEWRKEGKDRHSVWADPKFVDAEKRDFRLKPDSPALAQGFVPIDLSEVGPRR